MNFSEEKDSLSHCFNDDTVYVERILKKVVSYSLNSYFNEEGMQMTLTTLRKNRLINLYKTICILLKEELHNLMKVTKILLRFYIIRGSSKSRITKNLTNWMKTNMWYVNIKHQNIKTSNTERKFMFCFTVERWTNFLKRKMLWLEIQTTVQSLQDLAFAMTQGHSMKTQLTL